MTLCYNCRGLGHKTYECTKHFSCRNCGLAGHKERQCPLTEGGKEGWRPQSCGDLSPRPGSVKEAYTPTPSEAPWSSRGDGLLRLPESFEQHRLSRPGARTRLRPTPRRGGHSRYEESSRETRASETLQEVLSTYLDNLLAGDAEKRESAEAGKELVPRDVPSRDLLTPYLPEKGRSSRFSFALSDNVSIESGRKSPFAELPMYTPQSSCHRGVSIPVPDKPFGSNHTRMLESTSSWVEETDWDVATVDNNIVNTRKHWMQALPAEPHFTVACGVSCTKIAQSLSSGVANELRSKYSPPTSVVGRPVWLLNPTLLFAPQQDQPQPAELPVLAVRAPQDTPPAASWCSL